MDGLLTTDACTMPIAERPLRLAEFDDLFRRSVGSVDQAGTTTRLSMVGSSGLLDRVRDLIARESSCCSFFAFAINGDDSGLVLSIEVPPGRQDILDGLSTRAAELSA